MALRARKVSGVFEKRTPGPESNPGHIGGLQLLSPLRHSRSRKQISFVNDKELGDRNDCDSFTNTARGSFRAILNSTS